MSIVKRSLAESMRLIREGDLQGATAAIQRGLGATPGPAAAAAQPTSGVRVIEGEFEVVSDTSAEPPGQHPGFPELHFECAAGRIDYRLFVPSGRSTLGLPLLLMLHGCTQSPLDFAVGTRINALAEQQGIVVAWPAQTQKHNANKCWNWFRRRDQQMQQGESALLAALTVHLQQSHLLDRQQTFAAGLSAGAAMVSLLASLHPHLFAAIGLHSGLPAGVAHDLPSALAAMKQVPASVPPFASAVPCIVFHGDQDPTVNPGHAAAIITQCLGPIRPGALRIDLQKGAVPGGRSYSRTLYYNSDSQLQAEKWLVHRAAHAWSGGDPAGSWTDPAGPDAALEMLRFFAGCARSA